MTESGYPEAELLSNRASLFLFGGSGADRRAWVDEAAALSGLRAEIHEVTQATDLATALADAQSIVFVPDVVEMGESAQAALVRCLQEREERPKIVLGLTTSLNAAQQRGLLRDELVFRLKTAQVNLSDDATKQSIKARRAKAAARSKAKPGGEKRARRPRG